MVELFSIPDFLILGGTLQSIIAWVQEKDLRKELNVQYRQIHDWMHPSLTLSKLRKIRQLLLNVTVTLDLELSTCALAWVYFERLVLKVFYVMFLTCYRSFSLSIF
jgi:hypothetical protein